MRRLASALALAGSVAALAAVFTLPALAEWGTYRREAVLNGEVWRLATAMWVHLSWMHWAANSMAAAGLILLGVAANMPLRHLGLALLVCGLAVTVALLRVPDVAWYAGLSGALHGVALWLGITLATRAGPAQSAGGVEPSPESAAAGTAAQRLRLLGVALCAGVLVKLWFEQSWLSPVAYDPTWGFGVVRVAHGLGTFSGALWWCFGQWRTRRRPAARAEH